MDANSQIATLRLILFAALLFGFIAIENLFPRRRLAEPKSGRWFANLALSGIDQGLLRVLLPITAVKAAEWARDNHWGILNLLSLHQAISFGLSIVVMDLAIYCQHLAFHAVPIFWRFHRIHHADQEVDASTGVRFHPVEIILSALIKLGVVVLLGPPAMAVVVFEIVLNATSLFNHANMRLPSPFERLLRLVVVTPDLHRIHHSIRPEETNSNFGFNLPWWDRLFRTYRSQPKDGHESMELGIGEERGKQTRSIFWILGNPFSKSENPPGTRG